MNARICCLLTSIAIYATLAPAQHHHEPPPEQVKSQVKLLKGTGNVHHPVSTANKEAQQFFDQGLAMIYGFNHAEAIRSFRRAAELDPHLAMAHWGIALALGPNINAPMDPDAHKQAYEALKQAQKLAPHASPREQAYIEAIGKRYAEDPKADVAKLQRAYADAMRQVAQRFPDDLDAQTLFAESLMNLYPWKLWTLDGKPAPVTLEAVRVLESVMQRNPDHLGANHYYIHAVEASPEPGRALPAAYRLGKLAPAIGHLVHMPAHVWMRTGDYEQAAQANIDAAAADKAYLEQGGVQGIYLAYYAHNLHFLSAAYSMQGRYADSQRAAEECRRVMAPLAMEVPGFEGPITAALLVPVRFRDWDRVLKTPEPDPKQMTVHNLWHFARGIAYASKGQLEPARTERDKFREAISKIPEERTYGNNPERQVMQLPLFLLEAKIAEASGDLKQALGHLREAVTAEDQLAYNEPPDWYYPPSREALGAILLRLGEASEAEKVFRADLGINQRNGRSLFGLWESLKMQKKSDDAALIEPMYNTAWSKADRPLELKDLF
jgi:tetratricopeptide (TPR) repeat protein